MLLQPLTFLINRYLAMDPVTFSAMQELAGRVIAIEITDWPIAFYIEFLHEGVTLHSSYSDVVSTRLRSTLSNFVRVLRAKGDRRVLFNYPIDMEGDVATAEAMYRIFGEMDIDWEAQLSQLTGDVVAHQIGRGVRKLASIATETRTHVARSLTYFLQSEIELLPTRNSVAAFCDSVTELSERADRLMAKWEHKLRD